MMYSNWPVWIGLFLVVSVGFVLLRKPTKQRSPSGPFDNPIHTKPIFKLASLIIILVSIGLFYGTY